MSDIGLRARAGRRKSFIVALCVGISLLVVPSTSAAARNRHWIGVRERAGRLELFDRHTGDPFVPRGMNLYVKVREGGEFASTLFRPGDWKPRWVDRQLSLMAAQGYNVVRPLIDACRRDCISTSGAGVRQAYVDNIASFLKMARELGLVVILSSNDLPDPGYGERLPCCHPFGGYRNSLWLTPKGHHILVEYWKDVVEALKRAHAPLDAVIYELQQEQFLLSDVEPLSLTEGTVTTADGATYDMADPVQKAAMIDANVRLATRRARAAIRREDPGALVTMGFFADFPDDPRVVPSRAMLESSALDLVDLHLYPGASFSFDDQVDALGLSDAVVKPIIMGEYGAFRFAYRDPRIASYALAHWQADSCAYGFSGWLEWLWARTDDEVFGAQEDNGAIARLLAPDTRPDPCSAEDVRTNVAPLATVTATSSLTDAPPDDATDELTHTLWNAGGYAPQWIQLDLGEVRSIGEIDLSVAQLPEGSTHHRLLLAGEDGVFSFATEFQGSTARFDVLAFAPEEPVDARFVRVETVASPSWVAWSEIQVWTPGTLSH